MEEWSDGVMELWNDGYFKVQCSKIQIPGLKILVPYP